MKLRISLISLLLLVTFYSYSKKDFVNIHAKNPKLLQTIEMRFCYISFVKIDGKVFFRGPAFHWQTITGPE